MIIIYDRHIWSSYMIVIHDHHIWASYMIIIRDHHIWSSYMIITHDDHMDPHDLSSLCTKVVQHLEPGEGASGRGGARGTNFGRSRELCYTRPPGPLQPRPVWGIIYYIHIYYILYKHINIYYIVYIIYYILYIICYMLYVICYILYIIYYIL